MSFLFVLFRIIWTCCIILIEILFSVLRLIPVVKLVIPSAEKSVKGQTCLITGTGSGIGRLMALEFSKRGMTVILWDINSNSNKETQQMIKHAGGRAHVYTVDISERDQVFEAAQQVCQNHGYVDILVNNAAIVAGQSFLTLPDEMVEKTINVNLMSHFWTVKSFLPDMKKRNKGHIVTISSIAGLIGCKNLVDYCASKYANVGFHDALMMELSGENYTGIKTTLVCPYYMNMGIFAGCKTKQSRFFEHLEPAATVDIIMHGILTNKTVLYIPKKATYCSVLLKSILPVYSHNLIHKTIGANSFMDTFEGHSTNRIS